MEPLGRRNYIILMAVCLVFAAGCIAFALVDEHSMDYTDAVLTTYDPGVGDRVEFLVEDGAEDPYFIEFTILSVADDSYGCTAVRYQTDGAYVTSYSDLSVPAEVFSGDVSKLGEPLALKKTKTVVDTTDYAKLTCTRYKMSGPMDGFTTILERAGLPQSGMSSYASGTGTLRVYSYQDHLVDYDLRVSMDGAVGYTLRLSMVDIVPAAS